MMVYGTGFCVAMSDRRGVALSPHGDVIEKPEPIHAHLPSHAVRIEPYRAWKRQVCRAVLRPPRIINLGVRRSA